MDFIERLFHVSPDGGSGATEATFVIALAVIAGGVAFFIRWARARTSKGE